MAAIGVGLEGGKRKGDTFEAREDPEQSSFMEHELEALKVTDKQLGL